MPGAFLKKTAPTHVHVRKVGRRTAPARREGGRATALASRPAAAGVAVKVRLASHYAFAPLHDTPSRDIDYGGEHGAGGVLNDYLVSALRDAERLAGGGVTCQ